MIRNTARFNYGLFLLRRRRCASAAFRSAMLMLLVAVFATNPVPASAAPPDPVLDWIGIMNDAVIAGGTNALVTSRVVALVSASVFDAANGIEPRFQALHVKPNAPSRASQRAAAIQAAYVILLHLYPAQSGTLAAQRTASLMALASTERASFTDAGIAWGQTVADAIWAWRMTDGIAPAPPPFLGVLGIEGTPAALGAWRPTPKGNAFGAGPQFATMTPWVLTRPSQFRLPPPTGPEQPGVRRRSQRSEGDGDLLRVGSHADQSELALFWAGNTPLYRQY